MKNFIILCFFLSSSLAIGCADLKNKPKFMTHSQIKCGTIVNKIVAPKFIFKGKAYPYAHDMGDMWGDCPDPNRGCYTPYLNIQRRGNAICKAYGMGKYAKSTSYSPLFHYSHHTPDVMARLKRVNNGPTFAPALVRINHSRNEYSEVRELWCYPNYRKR